MSVSGPTDENVPAPGSAVPSDEDEDRTPDRDEASPPREEPAGADGEPDGEAPSGDVPYEAGQDEPGTRPCAYCGRPIPQPGDSSPVVRYCPDNGGACASAAAERRRRDQDAPGLAGQVARTWDMVERLEDVAELLAMSLTGG
ncbi:chromosome segregation ATPase, partial [Actinoallomurus acaciae]